MNDDLIARLTAYLASGGLFNPELANHEAVRDLIIDCRDALEAAKQQEPTLTNAEIDWRQQYHGIVDAPPAAPAVTDQARQDRIMELCRLSIGAEVDAYAHESTGMMNTAHRKRADELRAALEREVRKL